MSKLYSVWCNLRFRTTGSGMFYIYADSLKEAKRVYNRWYKPTFNAYVKRITRDYSNRSNYIRISKEKDY